MKDDLRFEVTREDDSFVARCVDVEVASDGQTEDEAVANLREALELYFQPSSKRFVSPS